MLSTIRTVQPEQVRKIPDTIIYILSFLVFWQQAPHVLAAAYALAHLAYRIIVPGVCQR